jgi:hypothetical protein
MKLLKIFNRLPRATAWLVVAAALLAVIGMVSPVQLPVVLYKVALIALAVVLSYWIDRALFPYARPDGYLVTDWRDELAAPDGKADHPVIAEYRWLFAIATLRRSIIMGAVVLGMALGL